MSIAMQRSVRRPGLILAGLTMTLLLSVAGAGWSRAGAKPAAEPAAGSQPTLAGLGLDFEAARRAAPAAREEALRALAQRAQSLEARGLDGEQRAIAKLLWAEACLEMGDDARAAEAWRDAAKKTDDKSLAAAAALGEIQAIEAGGDDKQAAERARKWLKEYADSPLASELKLVLAWNRLRAGERKEAVQLIDGLAKSSPWLLRDPRLILAQATVAYLEGRYNDALTLLEGRQDGAATLYLRALASAGRGDVLKAAAAFQEIERRYPDSPLRDYALLAKANAYLKSGVYRSAAEEFARVAEAVSAPAVRAEASLRRAAAVFLDGDGEGATPLLRAVVEAYPRTEVGARGQYLLGEIALAAGRHQDAIVEFNRVLTSYFDQSVAASAQYRIGRCYDALVRRQDAVAAYQAVVSGYPLEPEAPAAAYLAGVGLLEGNRPREAAPYFQLVLDRYAKKEGADGAVVFAKPEHQELVEADLCLLELAYHRAGDLGQLAGASHVLLQKMPPTKSPWRAYALLIDADALAAQGMHDESRASLDRLFAAYPTHPAALPATQLLAWIQAEQGQQDAAMRTVQQMLARYGGQSDPQLLGQAYLNLAHLIFNQKRYPDAAAAYEDFLARYPEDPQRALAFYQAGLCYQRMDRNGDAVDRWEAVVKTDPQADIAERAWIRAGDVYFQTEHYEDAKRCYQGLLANFAGSQAAALGQLRIAQCDYNAARDSEALAGYALVTERFPGSPMAAEAERGMTASLYRLGQQAKGVDELKQLVQKYPSSAFAADAQFRIAQKLYEQKQYPESAEEFRRVVSGFPGYEACDRAQFLMGDAYAQAGSTDAARGAFEQFLIFFSDSKLQTTVKFRLGMLYFEQKDYMRAAINFTGVLDQQAQAEREVASAALYNLALCKRLLGDAPGAQAELSRYREMYPGDQRAADVTFQLGDLLDQAGRTDEAIVELERALAAGPTDASAIELQFRLGQCQEKLGAKEKALGAYRQAAGAKDKRNPFRLSAVARSAALLEEKQDWRQALAAYRDLMANAQDSELVAVATQRAKELASVVK